MKSSQKPKNVRHFFHFYISELIHALVEPIFLFLTLVSFVLNMAGATAFYIVEHAANPKIDSFLAALYFTVTTTTGVGFGDIAPETAIGRILSMALMLLGTALFAAFTATLAATLLDLGLKRKNISKLGTNQDTSHHSHH